MKPQLNLPHRIHSLCTSWMLVSLCVIPQVCAATANAEETVNKRLFSVGATRILFVDDHVIAELNNLKRVLHSPRRHPDNPILIGDQPWESWLIEANGRTVVYDPETGKFKLYYVIWTADRKAPFGARYLTCLATSGDGIHWKKPAIGQYGWNSATENNIIKVGDHWMRRPNVIRDRQESDPKRRFKITFVDVIDGRTAIVKATSADGVHWKRDRRPWFRRAHGLNLLEWDLQIGQYVFFPRISRPRRGVGRSTSKDFVTWTQPKMVITPDADEQHLRFKRLAAFCYEGVYFGSLWVFEDNQRAEAELAFSRDGIHWGRPFPGQMFFPRGASDA